jgi:hypothetical protein
MSSTKPAQVAPTAHPLASPNPSTIDGLRRYAGPTALVAGSVLTIAGMTLHVAGDGSPADEALVRTVEAQLTQWLASHLLLAFGMALVAAGVVTAFRVARGRGAALTRAGAALTATGAALMSFGDLAHGAVAYALAGHVDAATSLASQDAYFSRPAIAVISFGGMLMPVGVLVLGVALLRSRVVPRWAAIALLVSPIAISWGFASGPRMLVLGLPFLVGMAALGRAIARS